MGCVSGTRLVRWRETGTYLAVGAGAVGGVVSGRHIELQIKHSYISEKMSRSSQAERERDEEGGGRA